MKFEKAPEFSAAEIKRIKTAAFRSFKYGKRVGFAGDIELLQKYISEDEDTYQVSRYTRPKSFETRDVQMRHYTVDALKTSPYLTRDDVIRYRNQLELDFEKKYGYGIYEIAKRQLNSYDKNAARVVFEGQTFILDHKKESYLNVVMLTEAQNDPIESVKVIGWDSFDKDYKSLESAFETAQSAVKELNDEETQKVYQNFFKEHLDNKLSIKADLSFTAGDVRDNALELRAYPTWEDTRIQGVKIELTRRYLEKQSEKEPYLTSERVENLIETPDLLGTGADVLHKFYELADSSENALEVFEQFPDILNNIQAAAWQKIPLRKTAAPTTLDSDPVELKLAQEARQIILGHATGTTDLSNETMIRIARALDEEFGKRVDDDKYQNISDLDVISAYAQDVAELDLTGAPLFMLDQKLDTLTDRQAFQIAQALGDTEVDGKYAEFVADVKKETIAYFSGWSNKIKPTLENVLEVGEFPKGTDITPENIWRCVHGESFYVDANIYDFIKYKGGVDDTITRENLFKWASYEMNLPYANFYNAWLDSDSPVITTDLLSAEDNGAYEYKSLLPHGGYIYLSYQADDDSPASTVFVMVTHGDYQVREFNLEFNPLIDGHKPLDFVRETLLEAQYGAGQNTTHQLIDKISELETNILDDRRENDEIKQSLAEAEHDALVQHEENDLQLSEDLGISEFVTMQELDDFSKELEGLLSKTDEVIESLKKEAFRTEESAANHGLGEEYTNEVILSDTAISAVQELRNEIETLEQSIRKDDLKTQSVIEAIEGLPVYQAVNASVEADGSVNTFDPNYPKAEDYKKTTVKALLSEINLELVSESGGISLKDSNGNLTYLNDDISVISDKLSQNHNEIIFDFSLANLTYDFGQSPEKTQEAYKVASEALDDFLEGYYEVDYKTPVLQEEIDIQTLEQFDDETLYANVFKSKGADNFEIHLTSDRKQKINDDGEYALEHSLEAVKATLRKVEDQLDFVDTPQELSAYYENMDEYRDLSQSEFEKTFALVKQAQDDIPDVPDFFEIHNQKEDTIISHEKDEKFFSDEAIKKSENGKIEVESEELIKQFNEQILIKHFNDRFNEQHSVMTAWDSGREGIIQIGLEDGVFSGKQPFFEIDLNQKTVIPNGYHVLQGLFSQNEDIKNVMTDFVATNPDYRLFNMDISVEASDLVYLGLAEQARKFVVEFSENPTLAEGQEVTKELIEKIISIDSLNEFSRGYEKLYIDEVFKNGEVTESEPYLRIDLGDGLVENKQYYLDLAEKIGLTPKDIGFGKSQEDIQLDLQAVEFSDPYKNSEKVPQAQDLTLALEDSESFEWGDDSRLFVRAELLDFNTGETVIHTPFIVDKPTETDFLTWWQDNYKAIDKQIRSSDEVVALEKELDFRKLPKLEQEQILDEQNGVLNLFDDENNSSKLKQIVDQIDIEEDSQVTEQQTKEKSIPTKEEDNSRLAQAQRKLERLERELSEAMDEMYAHQKLTNGQPMNDKRNGPAWFKRREELERKARNLDSELKDHRDRVDRLEQQVFNKEHGLNKQGTGLEMSVGNIDNIKRAIETGELIEGNKAKLSGETIKKYQKELVKLEEMKHNSEKVQGIMSDATKALIASGDIQQWIKQPTLYFVNGLQKVALELDAETGEFKISQKYAPKTQTDKDFVDNLLVKYNTEKAEPISTLQEILDDLDNHPELVPEVTELEKSLTDVSRYADVDKDSPAIAELQSKMGLGSTEFVSENRAEPTVENDEVGKIITQISDGFVTMSQRAPLDSDPDKIDLAILDERMNTIQSFSVGVLNVTAVETKEERREQTAYHLLGELAQASEIGQNDLSAINVISTFSLLDTPEVSVTFEDVKKVEELAKTFSKAKIVEEIVEKPTENTVTPYKSKDVTIEQMMNDAAVQIREYSKNPADLKSYMDFMSNFPQYSAKNNALLRRQWRGAVAVATFDQWAKLGDKLGIRSDDLETDRVTFKNEKTGEEKVIENGSLSVKKGEKSNIYLFRPQTTKVIPLLDENGKQKKNDKGYPMFKPSFKATAEEKAKIANGTLKVESRPSIAEGKVQFAKFPVYDITQTNLKPSSYPKAMPNRKVDYDVDIDSANNMMRGLKAYSDKIKVPVFVDENNFLGNAKGAFRHSEITGEQHIIMNPRNTETDNIATLIHELAHATLHNPLTEYKEDMSTNRKELEAEMTSYIVSKHFGMDTAEDSIGYMADWSKQLTVLSDEELDHSFIRIGGTVKTIVKSIEREFEIAPVKNKDIATNVGKPINQPKVKGR